MMSPLLPGDGWHGIHHRFRVMIRAAALATGRVTILHLVPPDDPALAVPAATLNAAQSELWGTEVEVRLAPTQPVLRGFQAHYLDGLLRPLRQPDYRRFTGPEQIAAVARLLTEKPELVLAQRLPAMATLLAGRLRPPRLAFDMDDLEHKLRWRTALARPLRPGSLFYAAHAVRLITAVASAVRHADVTFVCSASDRKHFDYLGLGRSVRVLPNSVPFPPLAAVPGVAQEETLLFLGNLAHEPNRQAAGRLVTRIWPLIRAQRSNARLIVAGDGAERVEGFHSSSAGVSFPGFVQSLSELYASSRVVVCPIGIGSGTRLKLVEAAAYARPIVSTWIGAEGLDFQDGCEILLRDDDVSFAAACVELLADQRRCGQLGAAARARAQVLYDASTIEEQLVQAFKTLNPKGRSQGEAVRNRRDARISSIPM